LHSETLVISSLFISFLLIIFIPPFLCATITKKLRHHSIREHSAIDKVYNSGMIQSGNTETTQVYGEKSTGFISKKSIGIQLSMQNTPRLSRVGVQAESPLPRGTSSMSASDELEYDYYDGTTIPGSLLAPVNGHMTSIIDIDQIIGESSIFSTRDEGQNTQNQI
uniref:Transmembrane protein n=1 Tax=Angiostrongylus cantonensis TaxID=6313 RepID=A0A0K0D2Y7_ANGCA